MCFAHHFISFYWDFVNDPPPKASLDWPFYRSYWINRIKSFRLSTEHFPSHIFVYKRKRGILWITLYTREIIYIPLLKTKLSKTNKRTKYNHWQGVNTRNNNSTEMEYIWRVNGCDSRFQQHLLQNAVLIAKLCLTYNKSPGANES